MGDLGGGGQKHSTSPPEKKIIYGTLFLLILGPFLYMEEGLFSPFGGSFSPWGGGGVGSAEGRGGEYFFLLC